MHGKPEFRASERFSHEHVITLEDDPTLTQYYAESCNLSERGMYFRSPFELYPKDHVLVRIDDYKFSQNQVPAKIVWCKKLEDTSFFSYGVGVEFAQTVFGTGFSDVRASFFPTLHRRFVVRGTG